MRDKRESNCLVWEHSINHESNKWIQNRRLAEFDGAISLMVENKYSEKNYYITEVLLKVKYLQRTKKPMQAAEYSFEQSFRGSSVSSFFFNDNRNDSSAEDEEDETMASRTSQS